MGSVFGEILPYAVAVAISPIPIIAVILMLFSAHASANAPAFLGGWVAGLLAVTLIVLALSGFLGVGTGAPPAWVSLLKLVLGVLLLLLGWEKLHEPPSLGDRGTDAQVAPGGRSADTRQVVRDGRAAVGRQSQEPHPRGRRRTRHRPRPVCRPAKPPSRCWRSSSSDR